MIINVAYAIAIITTLLRNMSAPNNNDKAAVIPTDEGSNDSTKPGFYSTKQGDDFRWPPLESNPEVFAQYLHSIGLPLPSALSGTLDNACGIIACIHAIMNCPLVTLDPSTTLGAYKQRVETFTPTERKTALEQDTAFQKAHKKHAARGQTAAVNSDQSKVKHHFIAYVLNNEEDLVELDGTKAGPVIIGKCDGDLLRGSIKEVKGKLERGEISESLSMMTFNLANE
ncbi:ubiquitin carboxyl-terminal hydrolase [Skeletonema marinoi]|uniref:ubiquitinyl hydrolase 1 n=1 Tax=Skeletonema marinoi TaxID=267567 RepID=A0AAD8XR92_9STRA|nr:ubiquitin carboxyl-terminal hydrolase [Skeletonema marinoi]